MIDHLRGALDIACAPRSELHDFVLVFAGLSLGMLTAFAIRWLRGTL